MHEKSVFNSLNQRIIANDRAYTGDHEGAGDGQHLDNRAARQTRAAECLSEVKKNESDRRQRRGQTKTENER